MAPTRRVLVCVSGMSPAIVTETLYALLTQPQPFVPDEVHVITTTTGRSKLVQALLHPNDGQFHVLVQQYADLLGGRVPRLDEGTLHVIAHQQRPDEELKDIATLDDNLAAAQTVYRVLHELKAVPGTQVHASVAGGRKSMSFYMGQAFSLLADEADVLSHVLVNEPFEEPGFQFFFPPRVARELSYVNEHAGDTRRCNTADARLELATLSALKLGPMLREALPARALQDFDTAVLMAQAMFQPPAARLRVERHRGGVEFCGVRAELPGVPFVLLALQVLARNELGCGLNPDSYNSKGWEALVRALNLDNLRLEGGAPVTASGYSKIVSGLRPELGRLAKCFQVGQRGKGLATGFQLNRAAPPIALEGFSELALKELRKAAQAMAVAPQAPE